MAKEGAWKETMQRCDQWVEKRAGGTTPALLAKALEERYGKDRTFSVPILMACALGGGLGPAPDCWKLVPQLPFELAALPRGLFAAVRMPVVSYALPALIAIGQVRFHHVRGNPVAALWRSAVRKKTLRLLQTIQPQGGGFLEATPLTSFVTMALSDMGLQNHSVVKEAVGFLVRSAREDGAWPIDTNLATWVTTLSVKALDGMVPDNAGAIRRWLLSQQYKTIHLYTGSPPGGWAWTDLPGGVPDADDTSGALIALRLLGESDDSAAALNGVRWLLGLQNRDGGIPTFCRGWGTLPFDRSTPEITAHTLAAFHAWQHLPEPRLKPAMQRMLKYLRHTQHADGWWEPLWFGNEHTPSETNPVYGTAAVLKYLTSVPGTDDLRQLAAAWLIKVRRSDGSWSGDGGDLPPSVEETAAAVEALALYGINEDTLTQSIDSLLALTAGATQFPSSPIGLYFAKLWYHERLYPLIAATGALRAVAGRTRG